VAVKDGDIGGSRKSRAGGKIKGGKNMNYQLVGVGEEYIGVVWRENGARPQIEHIFLPQRKAAVVAAIKKAFPAVAVRERKMPGIIARQIAEIYSGREVRLDYSILNLQQLSEFARKALRETCKIPRGKVATYSGLAAKIGSPQAARAVGTALANNPLPLLIPCHRVVRADGSLGGFGGGLKMKKALLTREGVAFDASGEKCL